MFAVKDFAQHLKNIPINRERVGRILWWQFLPRMKFEISVNNLRCSLIIDNAT